MTEPTEQPIATSDDKEEKAQVDAVENDTSVQADEAPITDEEAAAQMGGG